MNHLAHLWLAGPEPDVVIGAVLADFVRGAPDPAWSPALAAGVRLHRRIDAWTDQHPAVIRARAWFEPPFRRYAGILLDIWFDHLLAQDFERLTGEAPRVFMDRCYAVLKAGDASLPTAYHVFAARLARHDGLAIYAEREALDGVFQRLSGRLQRANPVGAALPVLEALERPLARAFDEFWPELAAFARRTREELGAR